MIFCTAAIYNHNLLAKLLLYVAAVYTYLTEQFKCVLIKKKNTVTYILKILSKIINEIPFLGLLLIATDCRKQSPSFSIDIPDPNYHFKDMS